MIGGAALSRASAGGSGSDRGGRGRDRARISEHDCRGRGADERDRGTPAYLFDGFIRGDFGATFGGGCKPRAGFPPPEDGVKPCASYPAGEIDDLLRERVPIDLQLLLGGLLIGTLAGVVGGRICATRPGSAAARILHVATAFLLSCPPYFVAFLIPSDPPSPTGAGWCCGCRSCRA